MKQALREDEEFLESERPRIIPVTGIRITKTKAVIKQDDEDRAEIEIQRTNGGGLSFSFTTRQEVTTEEVVKCEMGHKHRQIVQKDYSYEHVTIGRREAKMLLAWLNGDELQ